MNSLGNEAMRKVSGKSVLQMMSMGALAACIAIAVWGVQSGMFTSRQAMEEVIARLGVTGPVIFILIQAVQVVLPILPGGISCLAGVILFGTVNGFIYNYAGICIGSLLAFALAKNCGRPLLPRLFGEEFLQKYDGWTENKNRFERLFALAIFFPVAPDDFLCYLAGTTTMSWKKFMTVILLGKPFSILLYSLLLNTLWSRILLWLPLKRNAGGQR